MNGSVRKTFLSLALIATVFTGACSTSADQQIMVGDIVIQDPLEETNRAIFAMNTAIDNAIIHHIIDGYRFVVPELARDGIGNFLTNLSSPVHLMNQILQGDVKGAVTVAERAMINSFVGLAGLFDVAGHEGIEHEGEDFGQTLAVWGVDHGPYLVIPVLGVGSTRDIVGNVVDGMADPLRWYVYNIDEEHLHYNRMGLSYLDLRDSLKDVLEDLERSSIDYYAATRSIYYQRRDAMVRDEGPENASSGTADFDDF